MKQYARYPFRVCVNDQFNRLSAPIENRYTRAEVEAWLLRAGLVARKDRTTPSLRETEFLDSRSNFDSQLIRMPRLGAVPK